MPAARVLACAGLSRPFLLLPLQTPRRPRTAEQKQRPTAAPRTRASGRSVSRGRCVNTALAESTRGTISASARWLLFKATQGIFSLNCVV